MSWKQAVYILFILLVALFAGIMGAVAGGVVVYNSLQDKLSQPQSTLQPVTVQETNILTTQIETAITQAVEKIGASVVTVIGVVPGQQFFFSYTSDQQISGSGVIISEDGYILTNNHVVEDTTEVSIVLADGTVQPARVVGTDIYADLAVLKVDAPVPSVAVLGNSDALKPGESVIAIGSPLGDFKNSVTVGVVSATGRMLDTGKGYQMENLIQTDAAINQGNSGGPLVNLAGEVIAINTLVVRGDGYSSSIAEGLGFAIPSNTAQAISDQIIQKGYFSRPYLGIRWQSVTPRIAAAYNLPVEWGVYITQVYSGSPAEKYGLQSGDIITRIGDVKLDEDHSYINTLFSYTPGQTVAIEVFRNNRTVEIEVTFGESRT